MDQQIADDVAKLKHWAFGNGEPGVDEKIRRLESTYAELLSGVKSLKQEIRALRNEREAQQNERAGMTKGVKWTLIAIITIFGGGGGFLGFRVLEALSTLQQALP